MRSVAAKASVGLLLGTSPIALVACGVSTVQPAVPSTSVSESVSSGAAFKGVNWNTLSYPVYRGGLFGPLHTTVLAPLYLDVGKTHLAIISYYLMSFLRVSLNKGIFTLLTGCSSWYLRWEVICYGKATRTRDKRGAYKERRWTSYLLSCHTLS